MITQAQQGHRYFHIDHGDVLAMASGPCVPVRAIEGEWLAPPVLVEAAALLPLPMRYFNGAVPMPPAP